MKISVIQARRMALYTQLLDGRSRLPEGKEGIARAIEKLGYIQIDTISVIERAHHHTLWTRCPDFTPGMLHDLQAKDRRIFEYWGHAASYLPISDYRFYLPRMRGFLEPHQKWEKQRLEKFGHMMQPVLERIRNEGPLSSKDFATSTGDQRGTWWDWRPAKVALELLFWRGELMITERRNFHRLYDLTERVLPEGTDTRVPGNDELGRFLVHRALAAYGLARENEILEHIHGTAKNIIIQAVHDLVEAGEIIEVTVGNQNNNKYIAVPDCLEAAAKLKKASPRLHLLSPFDNLIIQRERVNRLFDFDYTIECYVPAPKRKFGYFVLPILWGEQFAGRLDPKADRKSKTLLIRNLVLEDGFTVSETFLSSLAAKLWDLARFNACETIKIETAKPSKLGKELTRQIRRAAP